MQKDPNVSPFEHCATSQKHPWKGQATASDSTTCEHFWEIAVARVVRVKYNGIEVL